MVDGGDCAGAPSPAGTLIDEIAPSADRIGLTLPSITLNNPSLTETLLAPIHCSSQSGAPPDAALYRRKTIGKVLVSGCPLALANRPW